MAEIEKIEEIGKKEEPTSTIILKKKRATTKKSLKIIEDNYDPECDKPENAFDTKCNKFLLKTELLERNELTTPKRRQEKEEEKEHDYLYPTLNDPNFNLKIAEKKEFNDTKYDGELYDIKKHSNILSTAEFELSPHQSFVRNFLSFQTPYNSLLLYHGLGSGKTCSAIGVCEEQRDYLRQIGISKRTIIVASPNVQDNFRLQLFDERKLKMVDGLWTIKGCIGNKLLKEINPMNMKGLLREKVIGQIKNIINSSYYFFGYIEFANYIEKMEQVRGDYKSEKDKLNKMRRNLQHEFNNCLIVIDEVHNINASEDNKTKKVSQKLMDLVKSAENMRLLLLSATPMYNSYKEIIWLLNLMNINDRRGSVEHGDIFDGKTGEFKPGGEELLKHKITGYVSFVRGDNPYTFPFRVYPDIFSPDNTYANKNNVLPTIQMNGKPIVYDNAVDNKKSVLNLYLTQIGSYQSMGYAFIIDSLKKRKITVTTAVGTSREMPSFENMDAFGYTLLQIPLEALIIVYPIDNLEEAYRYIQSSTVELVKVATDEPEIEPFIYEPVAKEQPTKTIIGGQVSSEEKGQKQGLTQGLTQGLEQGLEQEIYINANDLTGRKGLENTMDYIDSNSPPEKGSFEYKHSTIQKYGRVFSPTEIGKYSSKIGHICSIIQANPEGIILIYSQYIDGGLIPMALALEELGLTRFGEKSKSLFKEAPTEPVDARTMKPRTNKKDRDFIPAKYTMITGDSRISPDNDYEVKSITSDENIQNSTSGNKIKVVLISKAGSEGLDFKCIRQVHILEPWYNMSRAEQIIGRGVRNFSHKDLDFEKRNVQIYMHGTLLENKKEESADLYIYRFAEKKAIQIGTITRILKEYSVDCIINHDQSKYTQENIAENMKDNRIAPIEQQLSTGLVIADFKVGDAPYSSTCDYMEKCEYESSPNKKIEDIIPVKEDTYNETFIMMNTEKLLQKIKMLMKERFFYIKDDLINLISTPKPYPKVQIFAALTQLIEDRSEFIIDKYGRSGYLINIGDYYLFQPSELNDTRISIFDRSVPIDYKHTSIQIEMKKNVAKINNLEREREGEREREREREGIPAKVVINKGLLLINEMKTKYDMVIKPSESSIQSSESTDNITEKGEHNWYFYCEKTINKIMKKTENESGIPLTDLKQFLVEHIVGELLFENKVVLLNYIYGIKEFNDLEHSFEIMVKNYLDSKIIRTSRLISIVLYSELKRKIIIFKNNKWIEAEPEDSREIENKLGELLAANNDDYNEYVGFMSYDNKYNNIIFKTKYTLGRRNVGARCDEAQKGRRIDILNKIVGKENEYTKKNTSGMVQHEMCSLLEMLMRNKNKIEKMNKKGDPTKTAKIWFLDLEDAILYKF